MDLKSLIIEEAKRKGICGEGLRTLAGADRIGEMVDYYMANPDWCMEREFPDYRTLEYGFGGYEAKGVYIGKTFDGELLNDLQAYVFHNCRGTIKVGLNEELGVIPMIYVGNGCRLRIIGVGSVKPRRLTEIPVYEFGKNDISARSNSYVKFNRYKFAVRYER